MRQKRFPVKFPWVTLYVTALVPLLTNIYVNLPWNLRSNLLLWLTSPFNVYYELQSVTALFYNYAFLVITVLLVELYTRNIADLKGRDSLIRNAFLFGVLSSYAVSGIIWFITGRPSSGTSIIGFTMLIFCAFETYDSELINRMSESRRSMKRVLELASLVFVALVVVLSALFFIYISQNGSWFIHIAGAIIFTPSYYIYLSKYVRPRVDRIEERVERGVETDMEQAGIKMEEEAEKLEKGIPRLGKRARHSSRGKPRR